MTMNEFAEWIEELHVKLCRSSQKLNKIRNAEVA